MNKEFLGIVAAVVHLKFPERHVAKHHVKVAVWELGVLKALNGDVRSLIELLCYLSRERVNLHAVEPAVRHAVGKQAQEVAHAAGRLQDAAFGEAKAVKGFVHCLDDNGRGIERRQGGFLCRTIFLWGQARIQLLKFLRPCCVVLVKRHRQTAPAHIFRKGFLFFGRRKAVFKLKLVQEIDRRHVVPKLFFCTANAKSVIGNMVIAAVIGVGGDRGLCGSCCFFFG